VDISKLPKCSEFTITSGGYEGLWTNIFIKPLAWIIIKTADLVNNYGISIILITLLIRLVMLPITKKTAMQSENLKEARPEIDKLEKKYSNKNDREEMMRKSQEMMMIYKKYNISPMSGCLFSLIQIPLFFAFYEALSRIPAIYEANFLGFQLGTSPSVAIANGSWWYIISIILIIGVTYFSFKLNSTASMSADQEKQMKMMSNIFTVVIFISSIYMATAIAVYWIANNAFTIIQNLLIRRRKINAKSI
jgi:YidC/Oxa1 family membrane protein insertase